MNHFLQKILLFLYPLQRTFRASPTIFLSPYINIYMQFFSSLQMHLHLKFIFHVISLPCPSVQICNIYCFLSKPGHGYLIHVFGGLAPRFTKSKSFLLSTTLEIGKCLRLKLWIGSKWSQLFDSEFTVCLN